MNKTEAKMVAALKAGKEHKSGNLIVRGPFPLDLEHSPAGIHYEVKYYASELCSYFPHRNLLVIYSQLNQSASTKSHMNAILEGFGLKQRITQRDFQWYFGTPQEQKLFDKKLTLELPPR